MSPCQGGSSRSVRSSSGSDRRLSDLDLDLVSLLCQVSCRLVPIAPINRPGLWLSSARNRFLSAARKQTQLKYRDNLPIIPLFSSVFYFCPQQPNSSLLPWLANKPKQPTEFSERSSHLHSWRGQTGALGGNTSAHGREPRGQKITVGSQNGRK